MTATIAEIECEVNLARVDARRARDSALEANAQVRKDSERLERVEEKVDVLIGEMRTLHAMRPKLDSLAALDLSDLTDAQKRAAHHRMFLHRVARLARRCGTAAAISVAGAVGLGLAFALLHALHINVPLEFLR